MVNLECVKRVYLYAGGVDFRKGIASLNNLILTEFKEENAINCLFVFFSRDKRQIKIIEIEENGTWLYQKKLKDSRFTFPCIDETTKVDKRQLQIILNNVERTRFKKRGCNE